MAGITAAIIGGAAALGGAAIGAIGASKAADKQAAAAQKGIDAQERMFERQTELQEPFRQGGLAAQNQLLTLLGIAPAPMPEAPVEYDKRGNIIPPKTPTSPQYTVDTSSPEFGSMARPFGMDQFEADPGYAFRLSEGMKALERSAAARGGLLSGQTLKGINRYGQDMGSQEYQNAFNRYQAERNARLNPLQSLMGAGQTATNQLTGAAGTLGTGLAQSYGNLGQAQASGYVGGANAAMQGVQGISGAVQSYYNNQFMNNFMNRQSQYGGGGALQYGQAMPG